MAIWNTIAQTISASTGDTYVIRHLGLPQCGQVSQAYVVSDGASPYFVKTQGRDRGHARAFAWEARSLRTFAAAGVRVPAVIGVGEHGTRAFIIMEFIAPTTGPSPEAIAEALIRLHRITGPAYGADAPGWGGIEPLDNTPADSWADFWCERRLRPRLSHRAAGTAWDHFRSRIEALLPTIRSGLATHQPTPTLLHGDLQSANWLGQPDGSVALIDAAMWYGDPDVDLAGLSVGPSAAREVLDCYLKECPRSPGFEWRVAVYRLWYLLQCHPGQAGRLLTEALDRIGQGPGD